jgi:hypothetical protein
METGTRKALDSSQVQEEAVSTILKPNISPT